MGMNLQDLDGRSKKSPYKEGAIQEAILVRASLGAHGNCFDDTCHVGGGSEEELKRKQRKSEEEEAREDNKMVVGSRFFFF